MNEFVSVYLMSTLYVFGVELRAVVPSLLLRLLCTEPKKRAFQPQGLSKTGVTKNTLRKLTKKERNTLKRTCKSKNFLNDFFGWFGEV